MCRRSVPLGLAILILMYVPAAADPFRCKTVQVTGPLRTTGDTTTVTTTNTTTTEVEKSPKLTRTTVTQTTVGPSEDTREIITTSTKVVTTQLADGTPPQIRTEPPNIQRSPIVKATPTSSVLDSAADCGFFLRSTLVDDQKGAAFSYGHDGAAHSNGFKTQFAAGYRSHPLVDGLIDFGLGRRQFSPYFLWDVDGNLGTGSQSTKKTSVLNLRPEFGWDLQWPAEDLSQFTGVFLRFGPMYETSQHFAVRNVLAEISGTVTMLGADGVNFGQYRALGDTGLKYRFRPYLAAQIGSNLHGALNSSEFNSTRLRIVPQPVLEFALGNPKSWGLDSAVAQLTDIYTIVPLEGRRITLKKSILTSSTTHNQFSASLQFGLTPNVTFGPSYTTGAIAPLFKRDTTVGVNLTLGFGTSGGEFLHPE